MSHPTILDVARRAGVSKSLVSMVMRGATNVSDERRGRVLAAAKELGYRPNLAAQSLVRQRSYVLGIIVSDLHNTFFADVVDGIDVAIRKTRYRSLIVSGHLAADREKEALDTLLRLRSDAVILAGPAVDIHEVAEAAEGIPLVVAGASTTHPNVASVTNNDEVGAALAVNHLVELGHRTIAHINGGTSAAGAQRSSGYEKAMRSHGLPVRVIPGSFTHEGGANGARAVLDSGEMPTAIFASNDLAAIGAHSVLAAAGIGVPSDVSLVGYDNTAAARSNLTPLTTIDQPRLAIGRAAAELALDQLESDADVRSIVLEPTLVVRGTTAPPSTPSQ